MKKIIFIVSLCMFIIVGYAQRKEISMAKDLLKKGKKLDKAEELLMTLLKNPKHSSNEKIWMLLYDVVEKGYSMGNERLYLKQQYDTASLFNSVKKMFYILEKVDSLDSKPDNKGKIKLHYRKKNGESLNKYRINLFNGGKYFLKKHEYKNAYDFFDTYINCINSPLFKRYDYLKKDKLLPEVAYWAVYSGYKMKNNAATLRHVYIALKDTAHYKYMLQYLSETYLNEGDTCRYLSTLKEGFDKYPRFPFFFPRLISYYTAVGDLKEAMNITNAALKVDSSNLVFKISKSTILLNLAKYKSCIEYSNTILQENDSIPLVYLNIGLSYYNLAIKSSKIKIKETCLKNSVQFYQNALPYLEEYRKMKPSDIDKWGLPLYTIYLNLNKGKEFKEIDELLKR